MEGKINIDYTINNPTSIYINFFLYFNNKSFNSKANNILSKLPGALGEYFYSSSDFDDVDSEYKKEYLANHFFYL